MSETKDDCYYYNWGGDLDRLKTRPLYPREYGARCEFHNEFFSSKRQLPDGNHKGLKPDCGTCEHYDNERKKVEEAIGNQAGKNQHFGYDENLELGKSAGVATTKCSTRIRETEKKRIRNE